MAKMKTRTNQPVIGGVADYIEQNGVTTELGGNLEVDGVLKASGGEEVITDIQAIIDEGNPELSLKQGNTIVGMVDVNPLLQNGEKMTGYSFTPKQTAIDAGVVFNYVGACKNGNKLTLVIAGTLTKNENTPYNLSLGDFVVPNEVNVKIYPDVNDTVDTKPVNLYSTRIAYISKPALFSKYEITGSIGASIYSVGESDVVVGTTYSFRLETTILLSESLLG